MRLDLIGVREFSEIMTRCGGLKAGSGTLPLAKARKGVKLHKSVQKYLAGQHPGYLAEKQVLFTYVPESAEEDAYGEETAGMETAAGAFTLDGRVDGYYLDGTTLVIDEIKSSDAHPDKADPAHWLQGALYGYILSLSDEDVERVNIEIIYGLYSDFNDIKIFTYEYTKDEIEPAVSPYLKRYSKYVREQDAHALKLHGELQELKFIYDEYRGGQRRMAVNIYNALNDPSIPMILCQAPTGIGKTAGTLFPALKSFPYKKGEKSAIFYLTARNEGSRPPEETLDLISGSVPELRYITLTAKEKICLMNASVPDTGTEGKFQCDPSCCPYAEKHYDNVEEALDRLLGSGKKRFDRELIRETAEECKVCPFELSLDLSTYCDVIIGDYNYLFDPESYLKRYFTTDGGQYYFLIDEAHQLPDRVRSMYSACLTAARFESAAKGRKRKKIGKSLMKVASMISDFAAQDSCDVLPVFSDTIPGFKEASSDTVEDTIPVKLNDELDRLCDAAFEYLETEPDRNLLELCFDVLHFKTISELTRNGGFAIKFRNEGVPSVNIYCLDPSAVIRKKCGSGLGSVLFSATLLPEIYYKGQLGAADMPYIFFDSPFPKENLLAVGGTFVDTRYRVREASLPLTASFITELGKSLKTGNYVCFFGSWKHMRSVYELIDKDFREKYVFMQPESSTLKDRSEFIAGFKKDPEELHMGFCVLGGAFSEGVDLPGNRLSGAVIVGTGVPQVNYVNELLKDYYASAGEADDGLPVDSVRSSGYDNAYFYPGVNKVIQAAGRVIRTPEDKGFVLLLDARYARRDHRNVFADVIDYRIIKEPQKTVDAVVEFLYGI
jgi:Rad3-related DNA helicase